MQHAEHPNHDKDRKCQRKLDERVTRQRDKCTAIRLTL